MRFFGDTVQRVPSTSPGTRFPPRTSRFAYVEFINTIFFMSFRSPDLRIRNLCLYATHAHPRPPRRCLSTLTPHLVSLG